MSAATKPWNWPAWRAHETLPADEQGAREYAVEALIRFGSIDGGAEPDAAVALLQRWARPDATVEYVAGKLADLVELSNDAADAEVVGGRADLDIAASTYAAVLFDFANGGQPTAPCPVDTAERGRLATAGWTVQQHGDGTWQTIRNGEVWGDDYPTADAAWGDVLAADPPYESCEVCRGGGCPHCDDTPGRVWVRTR